VRLGRYLALTYDYVPDVVGRRAPHREAHLALAREWAEDGRIVAGGALGDPPRGAFFAFDLEDPAAIDAFVEADPYVAAGLVTGWRVTTWTVVVSGHPGHLG
jgi:uncharacterized protein YciI